MTNNSNPSPHVTAVSGRQFSAFPAAIQALLVNDAAEILLLSSPRRRSHPNEWQVISGGLDANESILEGAIREAHEEAGAGIEIRPLGVVHAQTFTYDVKIPYMHSVHYLFHFLGGEVVPGDDMADSEVRWWRLDELASSDIVYHPSTSYWHLERAIQLWKIWSPNPPNLNCLQNLDLK